MPLVIDSGYTPTFADPDVQAYVTAVEEADGQALEYSVAYAINSFVLGCKQDGIWDAIKASCILAGARTLNGALIPLKGTAPTNNNFVSGDYNRKTGLMGNGITKYLDSNRNNNADPQNSNHNSVYFSESIGGVPLFLESDVNNSDVGSNALGWWNVGYYYMRNRKTGTEASITGTLQTGFIGASRNESSSFNGRAVGRSVNFSRASTIPVNGNIFLKCYGRLAFYSIGESLDLAKLDTRVTDLINAFAAAIP